MALAPRPRLVNAELFVSNHKKVFIPTDVCPAAGGKPINTYLPPGFRLA